MKNEMSPSHVAVLVPSVRKAADYLSQFDYQIGELDDFEETKEIYVQYGARNPLLLMEAKETGSYRKALQKRGPGIHHLAIDVLDMGKFISGLSGSGWLMHLNSLNAIKHGTVYLARPGFPALIEVQEKKSLTQGPLFVENLSLNIDASQTLLVKSIGLDEMVKASTKSPFLTIHGRSIELKNLF